MSRKENSNSLASRLQPEQFDTLREWLSVENLSYAEAVKRCEEQFGVETSTGALTNFFQKHCVGFKHKRARDLAGDVRKIFEADPDCDFGELTLRKIEQRAFEEAFAKDADVSDLQALTKILGDSRKLQLEWEKLDVAKRRIELLEKKAAFVDEMKDRAANREGGLTPEDMEEIERKLKLL